MNEHTLFWIYMTFVFFLACQLFLHTRIHINCTLCTVPDSSTLKRMLKPMPSTESPVTSPEMGRRRYGGAGPCPPACGAHGHRPHVHHPAHHAHAVNNNSRQSSQRYSSDRYRTSIVGSAFHPHSVSCLIYRVIHN